MIIAKIIAINAEQLLFIFLILPHFVFSAYFDTFIHPFPTKRSLDYPHRKEYTPADRSCHKQPPQADKKERIRRLKKPFFICLSFLIIPFRPPDFQPVSVCQQNRSRHASFFSKRLALFHRDAFGRVSQLIDRAAARGPMRYARSCSGTNRSVFRCRQRRRRYMLPAVTAPRRSRPQGEHCCKRAECWRRDCRLRSGP